VILPYQFLERLPLKSISGSRSWSWYPFGQKSRTSAGSRARGKKETPHAEKAPSWPTGTHLQRSLRNPEDLPGPALARDVPGSQVLELLPDCPSKPAPGNYRDRSQPCYWTRGRLFRTRVIGTGIPAASCRSRPQFGHMPPTQTRRQFPYFQWPSCTYTLLRSAARHQGQRILVPGSQGRGLLMDYLLTGAGISPVVHQDPGCYRGHIPKSSYRGL